MKGDDIQKVIEKVRKLLALSKSSNEHEAALAADRAATILAEHNLSMADVADRPQNGFETDSEIRTSSRPWRRRLGLACATLYFCKYFFGFSYDYKDPNDKRKYKRYDDHYFVGAPHNIAVAKLMFQYLLGTVERLAKEGALAYPMKERTSYINAFQHAATVRLSKRMWDRYQALRSGGKSEATGTTLPALASLYDQVQSQLDAAVESLKLGHHDKQGKVSHGQGFVDGLEAGNKIGLEAQLDGEANRHLITGSKAA